MNPASLIAAALVASSVLAFVAFFLSGRNKEAEEMARRLNQYGGTVAVTAPRVKTGNALRDLIESGPLTYVSTTNADGSPHVTAIWIGLDDDTILSTHMRFNAKLRNMRRDPRVVE